MERSSLKHHLGHTRFTSHKAVWNTGTFKVALQRTILTFSALMVNGSTIILKHRKYDIAIVEAALAPCNRQFRFKSNFKFQKVCESP